MSGSEPGVAPGGEHVWTVEDSACAHLHAVA